MAAALGEDEMNRTTDLLRFCIKAHFNLGNSVSSRLIDSLFKTATFFDSPPIHDLTSEKIINIFNR